MALRIETPRPQSVAHFRKRRGERGRILRIALVNNMPDAALTTTERQFASLIAAASGDLDVRLELVALESLPREAGVREAMRGRYGAPGDLFAAAPDALIVTGAEPRAPDLTDEPYWRELSALIDWARGGVASAVYSCLAAHAAVRRHDGIARRPRVGKLSGVFASEIVAAHELTHGLDAALTPHSRYNDLAESDLAAHGYRILSRSREAGVEMFVKDGATLEIYWQGHPEYDADSLAREYRRDLLRFLRGESARPPAVPENYLSDEKRARLEERIAALRGAAEELAVALQPEDFAPARALWRASAQRLMGNWLAAVARRKTLVADARHGSPAEPTRFAG
jgi:homoserine O-succinyltransferase